MPEAYIALTPVHWFYLVGVLVILFTMILRKDTPLVCIAFLFGIGVVGKCRLPAAMEFWLVCLGILACSCQNTSRDSGV